MEYEKVIDKVKKLQALVQCYCKITNRKEISYQHNKYSNIIYFSLTKTQEIDLRSMFDFYWKQLKKRTC